MASKTREIPEGAKLRPQGKRKSQHFKPGNTKQRTGKCADMKPWVEGERGLAKETPKHLLEAAAAASDGNGKNHIKALQPRHRMIARARVNECLSVSQLCRKFQYSRTQMGHICASPIFKEYCIKIENNLEDGVATLQEDMGRVAVRAMENLDDDVHMSIDNLDERKHRLVASKDVLDRSGVVRRTTPISGSTNIQINIETKLASMTTEEIFAFADKQFRALRKA